MRATPDTTLLPTETDVAVVGAGLSGAVIAAELAAAGLSVVLLERGRHWDPAEYRGPHDDWEAAATGPWHPSPNRRRLPEDYPIDDDAAEMKPLMFNAVGGSTIIYGAHWMRLLPSDFRRRTLDGVGDNWPIGYADLAPFYDRADHDFGASGIAGDPAGPARPDYPMPPLPIGAIGETVAAAHARLGWHWWPGSNAIASRPWQGRRPCVLRSACGEGCSEGAKASVDRTHLPRAVAAGARVIAGARVVQIETDVTGRANGVVWRDAAGLRQRLRAQIVVLAANALGSARLLLGSSPGGLANRSGLVGRRLMMHPFTRVAGLFDRPMGTSQGAWGQAIYSLEFAEADPANGRPHGAKWNLGPSGGPLHGALFPWPDGPPTGARLHERVAAWLDRAALWGITVDDPPEPENRVELDPDTPVDGDDLPGLRLTYRIAPECRDVLAFNAARARESFEAAGAVETVALPLAQDYGWHLLGTCRMGNDPETSVVDRWGEAHDHPGLFIADSSVFVTGGSMNPAATIAALSLRTAAHILASRSRS